MTPKPIYIGADGNATLSNMSVMVNGVATYLNTGTATWTVKDANENTIATGTMDYVAASNGNYLGVIESTDTAGLTELATYYLYLAFKQGNYDDKRRLTLEARYREEY